MNAPPRDNVVSSFTLIKGPLVEETYAVMAEWDPDGTKKENLDRLRSENYIGARSTAWLRDVAFVLNRRFEPHGRDRALVTLARGGVPLDEWRPILLWHITRDEFLLRDFLEHWLFTAYEAGVLQVSSEELALYLREIRDRGGLIEHEWSERTLSEVAGSLLRAAAEFGLLTGRATKRFRPYQLPERSFLYLLHVLRDENLNPDRLLGAPGWRMYLLRPSDVEHEILRLHQFRKLSYDVAGSLIQLSLPCESAAEYAEAMVA
jgi:hypothetical protein